MKDKSERCEVPVSAMIDVVFLLLVYFILTSTETIDEAFVQVNLPGPPDDPLKIKEPKNLIDIYVLEDTYQLMGKRYSLTEMDNYLVAAADAFDDVTVNVKVSKAATHDKLVLLLDSLNKAKLSKFSLHTLR